MITNAVWLESVCDNNNNNNNNNNLFVTGTYICQE